MLAELGYFPSIVFTLNTSEPYALVSVILPPLSLEHSLAD